MAGMLAAKLAHKPAKSIFSISFYLKIYLENFKNKEFLKTISSLLYL